MRILMTGGTGLIGRALCKHWQAQGHELWVLSRRPSQVTTLCSGARGVQSLGDLDTQRPWDAVVNLAGEPIADRPWTKGRRDVLWQSRIDLTRDLVSWMAKLKSPVPVLISASATGWYGDGANALMDENSQPGKQDFASRLCAAWEAQASQVRQQGTRLAIVRIAPVLSASGGMLARLLPVFRLGLGGRLGSGQQWAPWIHLHDLVGLMDQLLQNSQADGPFNACAPLAVRNFEFTQELAEAVGRPAFCHAPAWGLRLALGEMSQLLLSSQHLRPTRTLAMGYRFKFPVLRLALQDLLAAPKS